MIKSVQLTNISSTARCLKGSSSLKASALLTALKLATTFFALFISSLTYAQNLLVETNDFKYKYYDQVPSSGGGQKIAGIVLGDSREFTESLPRSLNIYVPIDAALADGTVLAKRTLCFELLSSGGNHKASWSLRVPKEATLKTHLQIDLGKELGRHLDLSEWRDTVQLLRTHTIQAIGIKSWPVVSDCRKDSISGVDLEYLPISWEKPDGTKPEQLMFLIPADGNPTIDAKWEGGSLSEKINCEEAQLGEGRRARFDYYCSIKLSEIKKADRVTITIKDMGVPYFSPVQLLY